MARDHEEQEGNPDRRDYRRGWFRRDRRSVAPAVLGGLSVFMLPGGAAPDPGTAAPALGGKEPPVRDATRGSRPLDRATLFVPSNPQAERQVREWRSHRPEDARSLERILSQPAATWFGDWNRDVRGEVDQLVGEADRQGRVPILVAYNIPNRDCNQHSAGGLGSPAEYRAWITEMARGIGDREAVVILEPDALALVSCLTPDGQAERFSLIREAATLLETETGATVYLDAGHGEWVPPEEMAQRLHLAGVQGTAGFALNVSNFIGTPANIAYGEQLSRRLGGAHFVIDTSRNGGNVAKGEWCNPSGASLGEAPTTATGHPLVDALLWIKRPGESDGECNGGPGAGQWWPEYALGLATGGALAE